MTGKEFLDKVKELDNAISAFDVSLGFLMAVR